ncbi:hypothetical protein N7489_004801 [Penicillium chrysogenum]|uniref:Uncharacterized protein n=1 Tax=Penicillium chrysogenum TaxID=5076 RepID=A0ABQ8WDD8_PENCH|nr:uncharacterized protein N7489_004801 [Penicillium chrysogenum]KAJ5244705.1 hypothetical protein N7489_004801 [Penicillium chrysogenum]KAJ5264620.1 hypothetical protein N7505_007413 [Penicillium chrysogenum]KAJ5849364.1 hypothetical protein N7534_008053 [Penicillium rubens]
MNESSATQQPSKRTLPTSPYVSTGSHSPNQNHVEKPCSIYSRTSLEDYALAMLAYTQSQVSSLVDLDENHGTSNRTCSSIISGTSEGSDLSAKSALHHQGPGLPNSAEGEEAGRQTANSAGCIQAQYYNYVYTESVSS